MQFPLQFLPTAGDRDQWEKVLAEIKLNVQLPFQRPLTGGLWGSYLGERMLGKVDPNVQFVLQFTPVAGGSQHHKKHYFSGTEWNALVNLQFRFLTTADHHHWEHNTNGQNVLRMLPFSLMIHFDFGVLLRHKG